MPLLGYTKMFERMLSHPNIHILLNSDYREIRSLIPHQHLIYTGPVDEYFDYCFGKLPYRSLRFEWETRDVAVAQEAPVVNYPNDHLYTRVTEFKYLSGQEHPKSTLVYEFPTDEGDPYYPVPTAANAALYAKYQKLAEATPEVQFLGRLGTYKYYNMDQVVAQALAHYAKMAGVPRREIAA
jgi:UDP-galactopyranose mutase